MGLVGVFTSIRSSGSFHGQGCNEYRMIRDVMDRQSTDIRPQPQPTNCTRRWKKPIRPSVYNGKEKKHARVVLALRSGANDSPRPLSAVQSRFAQDVGGRRPVLGGRTGGLLHVVAWVPSVLLLHRSPVRVARRYRRTTTRREATLPAHSTVPSMEPGLSAPAILSLAVDVDQFERPGLWFRGHCPSHALPPGRAMGGNWTSPKVANP